MTTSSQNPNVTVNNNESERAGFSFSLSNTAVKVIGGITVVVVAGAAIATVLAHRA